MGAKDFKEIKLITITVPKNIRFNLPKDVDKNLKHLIIKRNEFLIRLNNKVEISQLLSKNKHEDDIHEHRKQQNK